MTTVAKNAVRYLRQYSPETDRSCWEVCASVLRRTRPRRVRGPNSMTVAVWKCIPARPDWAQTTPCGDGQLFPLLCSLMLLLLHFFHVGPHTRALFVLAAGHRRRFPLIEWGIGEAIVFYYNSTARSLILLNAASTVGTTCVSNRLCWLWLFHQAPREVPTLAILRLSPLIPKGSSVHRQPTLMESGALKCHTTAQTPQHNKRFTNRPKRLTPQKTCYLVRHFWASEIVLVSYCLSFSKF